MAFLDKAGLERLWLHINSKLNKVGNATSFIKEASGETITVNDSAEQQLLGLKLYGKTTQTTTTGKNLLDIASIVPPSATYNGVTITSLGNGFTVKGTATGNAAFKWALTTPIPAGTYWLHAWNVGFNAACTLYFEKPGTVDVGHTTLSSNYRKQKIASDGDLVYLKLYIPSGQTVDMHLCPMLTVEETDTYEPYTGGIPSPNPNYPQPLVNVGAGGSIGVYARGKNLLSNTATTKTINGVTFTANEDYSVTAKGTASQYAPYEVGTITLPAGTYILSGAETVGKVVSESDYIRIVAVVNGSGICSSFGPESTFVLSETTTLTVRLDVTPGTAIDGTFWPMVRLVSADAVYEMPKDDGSVIAPTPNGLPGIPVSSGGNYTDASGQQWVCDEIDLARGVYIQRVGRILIDSTNTSLSLLNSDGLCQVYTSPSPYVTGYAVDPSPYMMCDTLPSVPRKNAAEQAINGASLTGDHILLRVVGVTTIAGMREWLVAHPTTVLYQPAQTIAIETPLSEAELTAYRAMTTQNPNTTIYNDSNAWMEVEYADSRIDEIEEALGLDNVNYSLLNLVDGSANGSVRSINSAREGAIIHDEYGKDTGETYTIGENAFAIGASTMAIGDYSYAEGYSTKAFGNRAHVEGEYNYARGSYSHAEGSATKTLGSGSHAEGQSTTAKGSYSHAEGIGTTAEGDGAHAEGYSSRATSGGAHAEGNNSLASAWASHAEGSSSATNNYAHAEGSNTTASGYGSHTEGNNTTASASYAHAEGTGTAATSDHSHAEGSGTTAESNAAHAEGTDTVAKGGSSHAEGHETLAEGAQSHAEGRETLAKGAESHAEGYKAQAIGRDSHAEGGETIANSDYSHAEGYKTQATGTYAHAEGQETKAEYNAHAEGYLTQATGNFSHAEGNTTVASKPYTHAEGINTTADNDGAHAEGNGTKALGTYSHAEGWETEATSEAAHAEGYKTHATNTNAHAEGSNTTASGYNSHAEGVNTIASGAQSHAEGGNTKAEAYQSHAEGYGTTASSDQSHAEGYYTTASGTCSHAEGYYSVASQSNAHAEGWQARAEGPVSHAEGSGVVAKGPVTHAEGSGTIATGQVSHVQGMYNIEDTSSTYAHIVGNGNSDTSRSNAHTLDWNGNTWYKGNIFMGGTSQTTAPVTMEYDSTNQCLNFVFK